MFLCLVEIAEGKDAEELERFVENQRKIREQEIKEKQKKQERRAEINREIAEKKRKNRKNKDYEKRQLKLFGDL